MKRSIFLLISLTVCLACKNTDSQRSKSQQYTGYTTTVDIDRTVLEILDQSPKYNSFLKLVNAASYFEEIENMEDIMVFVPTDEAFGPGLYKINELSEPENLTRLNDILRYHFAQGDLDSENLINTTKLQGTPIRLQTLNGGYLAISLDQGKLKVLDENTGIAIIEESSIRGSNGIVFAIDKILIPREEMPVDSTETSP